MAVRSDSTVGFIESEPKYIMSDGRVYEKMVVHERACVAEIDLPIDEVMKFINSEKYRWLKEHAHGPLDQVRYTSYEDFKLHIRFVTRLDGPAATYYRLKYC
jgi:hypothetical protein